MEDVSNGAVSPDPIARDDAGTSDPTDNASGTKPAAGASAELLAALIEDHGHTVYRVAVAIVHDHSLAEDVVQDVMLRAWRSLPADAAEIPLGWLRVVTRNAAIDLLRRRRFHDVTELPPEPVAPATGETDRIVEGRQHLDAVWGALATLDDDARAMLILQESEDMGYRELAEMFETTVPAVKTKIYRARHALRREVREWDV